MTSSLASSVNEFWKGIARDVQHTPAGKACICTSRSFVTSHHITGNNQLQWYLMAGDSQATFSLSVRNAIRRTYEYRCVICSGRSLGQQLRNTVELGVLPEDYKRNADEWHGSMPKLSHLFH